jgi:hypothetical protein
MFIRLNIFCSECGSGNYESFSNRQYHGIRCKSCGHEKKEPYSPSNSTDVEYKKYRERRETF